MADSSSIGLSLAPEGLTTEGNLPLPTLNFTQTAVQLDEDTTRFKLSTDPSQYQRYFDLVENAGDAFTELDKLPIGTAYGATTPSLSTADEKFSAGASFAYDPLKLTSAIGTLFKRDQTDKGIDALIKTVLGSELYAYGELNLDDVVSITLGLNPTGKSIDESLLRVPESTKLPVGARVLTALNPLLEVKIYHGVPPEQKSDSSFPLPDPLK